MTTPLVRTATIDAESEHNAGIDAAGIVRRMKDAGWTEASRVWAEGRPNYGDVFFKGWLWANASAGGRLTITFVRDGSTEAHHAIRAFAEKLGAVEALEQLATELDHDRAWSAFPYATIAQLRSSDRMGLGARQALAALPARLRLYVEYALAESIAFTFRRKRPHS